MNAATKTTSPTPSAKKAPVRGQARSVPPTPLPHPSFFDAVAHLVVRDGVIRHVATAVATELGCDTATMLRPLVEIGERLDEGTFADLYAGTRPIRLRLGAEFLDRPVQLRLLGVSGDDYWIEIRSLAHEFRLESLLRRSGAGHMLISPSIELLWSLTSNKLSDIFPGDDPRNWIEIMDPDDMQTLGKAIFAVGKDPTERRTVRHRLHADRTYTIVDEVESVVHDPDLRCVLVRSRPEAADVERNPSSPFAGMTVSDHMPIGVLVTTLAGKILHRNAVAAKLLGVGAGQSVVPNDDCEWTLSRLSPEHVSAFQSVFYGAAAGKPGHCIIASPVAEGRWLRLSVSPALVSTIVISIEDMTELEETERALRASNRLLEALDSHSEELVVVLDESGRTRYRSSSVQRHIGPNASIDKVSDFIQYVHKSDRTIVSELYERVRSGPTVSEAVEIRIDVDDPAGRWHRTTMTNLLDDPDVRGLVLTSRDIHERHLAERELRYWATHDALTTLPDRAALRSRLETILEEADLFGRRTALVFCDIDNFKEFNDRLGHHVGDLILTELAGRLRSVLRTSDFVCRFGGDEFVVVLPNIDDEEHAMVVAERVFEGVIGPAVVEGNRVDISLSMGVSITNSMCRSGDDLLQRADHAMYQSKNKGRRRLSLYSDESLTRP